MQSALKRKIASYAILLIALHALFPGLVALSASATTIDQAIICHTDAGGLNQPAPQPSSTENCCAHCILCNGLAAAAPIAAQSYVIWTVAGDVLAVRSSHEPSAPRRPSANFARGPPPAA